MTTETKAPTAEDVERQYRDVEEAVITGNHTSGCAARGGQCRCALSVGLTSARALHDLALLGVQVPGLQEQLQGVTDRWEDAKSAAGQHLDSLSASRREVSALQAQVAELERERDIYRENRDNVRIVRDRNASARDALQARVAELTRERDLLSTSNDEGVEIVSDLREERDALRAQVERLTMAASNCLDWLDCERDEDLKARAELRAALSTPPAEAPEDECAECEAPRYAHHAGGTARDCNAFTTPAEAKTADGVQGRDTEWLDSENPATPCPACGERRAEHRDYGTAALCPMR